MSSRVMVVSAVVLTGCVRLGFTLQTDDAQANDARANDARANDAQANDLQGDGGDQQEPDGAEPDLRLDTIADTIADTIGDALQSQDSLTADFQAPPLGDTCSLPFVIDLSGLPSAPNLRAGNTVLICTRDGLDS